jgi:hypothetical protein
VYLLDKFTRFWLFRFSKFQASALRLEAGRYSRDEMLHRTEKSVEGKIGQSLVQTFKPIKGILRKDEKVLNNMLLNPEP